MNLKEKVILGATVLLVGTLIAQMAVVALSILSIAKGINVPLLIERTSSNGATVFKVTFKATPLLILLSYGIAVVILWYRWQSKREGAVENRSTTKRGTSKGSTLTF